MIGYITLGSNDLTAAAAFFDEIFGKLGAKRAYSLDNLIAYQTDPKAPMIVINTPFDKEPATHGNGSMVALAATSAKQVDELHALALSLGATDEGAPGYRGERFYGAYFRDLDGNKFGVFVYM